MDVWMDGKWKWKRKLNNDVWTACFFVLCGTNEILSIWSCVKASECVCVICANVCCFSYEVTTRTVVYNFAPIRMVQTFNGKKSSG